MQRRGLPREFLAVLHMCVHTFLLQRAQQTHRHNYDRECLLQRRKKQNLSFCRTRAVCLFAPHSGSEHTLSPQIIFVLGRWTIRLACRSREAGRNRIWRLCHGHVGALSPRRAITLSTIPCWQITAKVAAIILIAATEIMEVQSRRHWT